jgi:hypothetical protein
MVAEVVTGGARPAAVRGGRRWATAWRQVRGGFSGAAAGVGGAAVAWGVYLAVYEASGKALWSQRTALPVAWLERWPSGVVRLLEALPAALAMTAASNPFFVVKTRMQLAALHPPLRPSLSGM